MIERNRPSENEGENVDQRFLAWLHSEFDLEEFDPGTAEGPAPEIVAQMESLVEELAGLDYPDVWVGEEGMTAVDLLRLQEENEMSPEWMRLEPGEVVQVEGTEGGIEIPKVGGTRLYSLDVIMHLEDEMESDSLAELCKEVFRIALAKEGKVLLKLEDMQQPYPVYRTTTVDKIPTELAEEFLGELHFYAYGAMGFPYVIPETERVKAFLVEHGEYFG